MSANRRLAAAITIYFVIVALIHAVNLPLFEASDEAAHFLYVHQLLEDRALPLIAPRETLNATDDIITRYAVENHQPPLYYALSALLISGSQRADLTQHLQFNPMIFIRGITADNHNVWLHNPHLGEGDTVSAIWTVRLLSLGLATVTLWLIYRSAALALRSESAALTVMFLVASLPTFVTISGSVNNDNLVNLLYAAGIYLVLRLWRFGVQRWIVAALWVVLGVMGITKITGLSLFSVVFVGLLIGVWRRYFTLRAAVVVFTGGVIAAALLSGWWYVRNLSLYGDPIASGATSAVWGRDFADPAESGDVLGEVWRVWRSFWLMIGHLHNPVYAPISFYVYTLIIGVFGAAGVIWAAVRRRIALDVLLLLLTAVLLLVGTLVYGTLSVDISYGRLLFPALTGFAVLLVVGWRQWLGQWTPVVVLPLAALTLLTPVVITPDAYPRLQVVEGVPPSAVPVNVRSGDLMLLAYQSHTDTAEPGELLRLTFYITGMHDDNPALFLTATDPISGASVGDWAAYPGMAASANLRADTIYQFPVSLTLDDLPEALSPRQLRVQVGWQTMLETEDLPMTDSSGVSVAALLLDSATLLDPRYNPTAWDNPVSVTYGGVVELKGYNLRQTKVAPGETLNFTLHWRSLQRVDVDYVATVQLLNAAGELVTQDDGDLLGYPTSAWRPGAATTDTRSLVIPPDTPSGEYRIHVGWYRLDDLTRLPARAEGVANDLYPLPTVITVE